MAYELLAIVAAAATPIIAKVVEKIIDFFGIPFIGSSEDMNEAVKTYSERIKEQHYPVMIEAALISNAKRDIRHYKNKCDVLKLAVEEMNENADAYSEDAINNLSNDWLDMFFDACAKFDNIEVQTVFAKILSAETQKQDSIPKSLIHSLSIIDSRQAKTFSILCQHNISFMNEIYAYCDYSDSSQYWNKIGVDFDDLLNLQEVGLITYSAPPFCTTFTPRVKSVNIKIGNKKSYVYTNQLGIIRILRDNVTFTTAGFALYQSLNIESDDVQIAHIKSKLFGA